MSQFLKTKLASTFLLAVAASTTLVSCRPGAESSKTPIHINPNMDEQEKYKAQEESKFFEDGRTMRLPVEGTVAKVVKNDGTLAETNPRLDKHLYEGLVYDGKIENLAGKTQRVREISKKLVPAKDLPSLETLGYKNDFKGLLERGRQRFDIYCAPCHGEAGDGNGIVGKRPGVAMPATNLQVSVKNAGEIYAYIKNGGPIMPAYDVQIPVKDRWAITAYTKVLQAAGKKAAAEAEAKAAAAPKVEKPAAPAKKLSKEELIAKGKTAVATCVACHATSKAEEAAKSVLAPSWVGLFGKKDRKVAVNGETKTIEVDDAYIRESILKPAAKVAFAEAGPFAGKAWPAAMAPMPVAAEDLDAVVEYIKSLSK